jgi:hypothetical protein
MTSELEKASSTPLPLPPSAWRITNDLQTAIERCLTEAGHQILWCRFSDNDYRHWHLRLLYGQSVDVSVDSKINPGTLKIVVCGDDSESIRTLLNRYQKIPILKIGITLIASELLFRIPETIRRQMPRSLAERLKFAARYCVGTAGYKIVQEQYDPVAGTWVVCLKNAQQLKIEGFGKLEGDRLPVSGFGTDLDRLQQLMAVFDASS